MSKNKKDAIYQYLNSDELQVLDDINEIQQKIHTHTSEKKKLENMTLKQLFYLWVKTNVDMINDLSNISLKKYNKYFDDIDNTKYWWRGLVIMFKTIFTIFTKDSRIIFTGINLIIVSILIYFISSSS